MSYETPLRAVPDPICRLADLPPLERRLVGYARLWRAGRAGRAALEVELAGRHGRTVGRAACDRLDEFLSLALAHSRRPLRLAEPGAGEALADECVLARLVALAAEGEREEAILIAALTIRADMSLELARVAMALGHQLLRRPGAVTPLRPAAG